MSFTHLYFPRNFYYTALFIFVTFLPRLKAQITQTFSYTGGVQTFTVPSCVNSLTILASGAQGVGVNGFAPGNGGRVRGVLNGAGGQVLAIYVGGSTSGYNGGGAGQNGANGGGASDVRLGGLTLNDRIIVAGGGGGAGGDNWSCNIGTGHGGGGVATATSGLNFMPGAGGAGFAVVSGCGLNGDTLGGTGGSGFHGGGGGGGGLLSGGAGASSTLGIAGSGSLGLGGSALMSPFSCSVNGTGGGGGGYYGGGGAAGNDCGGGRGGGGSSWTGTLSSPGFTSGVQTGDGLVTLIYNAGTMISASSSSPSLCTGSNATLTATGMVSYTWTSGSVPTVVSNNASVVVSPVQATTYTVSGTNTSSCVLSTVLTVSVDPAVPNISLTASSNTLCNGVASSFTVSGANSYTWSTGSNNSTLTLIPVANTIYSVVGKNACGVSQTINFTVNPTPTLSAVAITGTTSAAAASLCSGEGVNLVASGATTYSWTGNVQNNVTFYPQISSFYSVIGTNSAGCSGTATVALTVVTTPTAPIQSSSSSICSGASATLSSSGYGNYTWLPQNVSTTSVVVSPTVSTTYTLTKVNFGCSDTKTFVLNVFAVPQLTAIATPSQVCIGNSAVLSAMGASSYSWMPGNLSGANVTISPLVNTVYTLTASNGSCSASTSLSLTTVAGPTITVTASSSTLCAGESVILNGAGGTSYLWIPGNYTTQAIIANPLSTTQYTLTGANGVCSVTVYKTLTVSPSPTLIALASKNTVCSAETTTLFAGGAVTYTWSTGVNSTSTSVNPVISTIYTVSGSYSTGCSNSKTISVSVFEPTFAVNGPGSCCYSSTVQLIASGANSYTWNLGSHSPTLSVSPLNSSIYTVSATSSSNSANCVSTNTIALIVNPLPNVTASGVNTIICRGETAEVSAGGAITYTWNTLQTGSVAIVSPSLSFVYTVQGTDSNGCVDTGLVLVRVNLCSGFERKEGFSNNTLITFPNPSAGEIIVKGTHEEKLTLINQIGIPVLEIELKGENNFECFIRELKSGVYYLARTSGVDSFGKKILVLNK